MCTLIKTFTKLMFLLHDPTIAALRRYLGFHRPQGDCTREKGVRGNIADTSMAEREKIGGKRDRLGSEPGPCYIIHSMITVDDDIRDLFTYYTICISGDAAFSGGAAAAGAPTSTVSASVSSSDSSGTATPGGSSTCSCTAIPVIALK